MQKNNLTKVKTFTLGYENNAYDESVFSKRISSHLGTEHTDWILNQNEVLDHIPNMSKIYDEPFADSSQVPTYLVSKLAKQKVKVSLTGDGGDELFGGYNRYIYAPKIIEYQKYPSILKKLFKRLISSFTPGQLNKILDKINKFLPSSYRFLSLPEKLYKLSELIELNDQYQIYDSLISTWKKETPSLLKNDNKDNLSENFYKIGSSFQERMMLTDLNDYLIDDILVKVDRAAMSNSLETRVPFLNQELVDFALSIPLSMKINEKGKSKILLREILHKYIPQKMIDRPKAGFGIPIDSWLRGPLKEWSNP